MIVGAGHETSHQVASGVGVARWACDYWLYGLCFQVYMRHKGPVASPTVRGRDYVELFLDPDGKDNVVDRVIEEGYYVSRSNQILEGDGMGIESASKPGPEVECGGPMSANAAVEVMSSTDEPLAVSSNRGKKHSLMALVNSALEHLTDIDSPGAAEP